MSEFLARRTSQDERQTNPELPCRIEATLKYVRATCAARSGTFADKELLQCGREAHQVLSFHIIEFQEASGMSQHVAH